VRLQLHILEGDEDFEIAQGLAAILVVGSYYAARHFGAADQEITPESDAVIVRRLETLP